MCNGKRKAMWIEIYDLLLPIRFCILGMLLIAWLFTFLPYSHAYKILVFAPTISRSHMISNGRIADTLAGAGHQVTLFEPDFMHILETVNTSKVANRLSVTGFSTVLIDWLHEHNNDIFESESAMALNAAYLQYSLEFNKLCKELFDRDDVMSRLKAEKFDGFFSEQLGQQLLCGNGIAHVLGIKSHFWISSLPMSEDISWTLGMPNPVSYVPASYGLDVSNKMSYLERIQNMWYAMVLMVTARISDRHMNKLFRDKYGPDFPSLEQIAADSDIVFVASEEFIDFPRPTLPNVIHIGGLGIGEEPIELIEPFSSEMQKGDGIIYFSLGTNVNTTTLPKFAMKTVLQTAAKIKNVHFIIKIDENDEWSRHLAKGLPNVFLSTWVPQPAILAHERLRIFITHGGYNGIMEASRAAVPLITIPFMFDQTRNSRAVAARGWGISLRRQSLKESPEQLAEAIKEVLHNKKYKENACRISNLVRKKPFNATERLVKYTEFVLENNGMKELLVEGRNINFIIYFNLDILIPFIVLVYFFIRFSLRIVWSITKWVSIEPKMKLQ